jgi:2-polyprenyl-6-methoxyphenol hydroxylase-like FAD-dependent oxidoreductase
MPRIVVVGGGMCGLAAGILLTRDGHEVTVFERDPAPVPESVEEAWEQWTRDGVAQFRLAHFLAPAGREVLEEQAPRRLCRAGCSTATAVRSTTGGPC